MYWLTRSALRLAPVFRTNDMESYYSFFQSVVATITELEAPIFEFHKFHRQNSNLIELDLNKIRIIVKCKSLINRIDIKLKQASLLVDTVDPDVFEDCFSKISMDCGAEISFVKVAKNLIKKFYRK